MNKIGRNDPCPCGSGKKFKKCCQTSVDAVDFEYRRQRRVEADLMPRLLDYAFETYGPESFQQAWSVFNGAEEDDDEPVPEADSPINQVFVPWFLFNCEFADTKNPSDLRRTIAESFWVEHEPELTEDEMIFIDAANLAPFSLYEVLDVRSGVAMELCDLFTREKRYVTEHSATLTLEKGMIIYCALIEIGKVRSPLTLAPFPLKPTSKRIVVELRERMLESLETDKLTDTDVLDCDEEIRSLYFGLLIEQLTPPSLVNTDRESLIPQKVYFDLKSVDEAFERLKDLADEDKGDRLLERATIEGDRIVAVEIPWMGGKRSAEKSFENPILKGVLRLRDGCLVAEVNSGERADRIREIIEVRLGDLVTYKTTLIEPIDLAFGDTSDEGSTDKVARSLTGTDIVGGSSDADAPFLDPNQPEVKALLAELTKKHWGEWLDIPVPALNDVAPREASTTEEGRDLLESLFSEFEIRNKLDPNNVARPDIAALRRELEMD